MKLNFRGLKALQFILLIVLAAIPLSVFAQTAPTQKLDLGNGYSISVPQDWTVEADSLGAFNLYGDVVSMTVAAPYGLIMRGYDPADDATVLLANMLHVDKIFVSQRTFTTTSYGGRSAVSYGYVDKDGFTDTYIILDLSDGGHGYVYLITQGDGMDNNADEINAIISSFDYGSASAETSAAQGGDLLTQQVDLGDDYVISMPDGWTSSSSDGSHTLVGTEFQLVVTTPTELAASGIDPSLGDVGTVLIDTVNAAGDYQIARADIQKTRYVGRAGAAFSSSDGRTEQMEVFLTLNDGLYGKVVVVTDIGGLVNYADLIDAMITSFHNTNSPDDAPVSSSGSTSVPESSGVACTVRTGSANSAQLRVGPGTNRGAISFLPVDSDVTVTGRIELDGGGVWYQLDKSQAAPDGTAAAELWVSAELVDASGDCDHVGETSAPPIIPIAVAPPVSAGDAGAPSDQPSGATAGANALPTTGNWTLFINANANASCEGYENVSFSSTELYNSLTDTFYVYTVNRDTFNYGQSNFNRIAGTNSFYGSFSLEGNTNAQMRFELVSPTSMRGSITGNYVIDGINCSTTILFSTNHN